MQNASDAKSKAAFGVFSRSLDDPQHGLFGGYSSQLAGRPLEFHCTAPIKPNRAQEILYGPTLEPFLYGEQIGQTLLERRRQPRWSSAPTAPPALAVREHVQMPVALVLPGRKQARPGRLPRRSRRQHWRRTVRTADDHG